MKKDKVSNLLNYIDKWHNLASKNHNILANFYFKKCSKLLNSISFEEKKIIISKDSLNDWQKFWILRSLFIERQEEHFLKSIEILQSSKDLITKVDASIFLSSIKDGASR